jgi:cob(I)alamin adenosyltransferase
MGWNQHGKKSGNGANLLEGREFQQALMRFQAHVFQVFEDLRKQTGLQLIRAIIHRDEVKTVESVVKKIRSRTRGFS